MEHDGLVDLLNQCRQDQLRQNVSNAGQISERDYETFGQTQKDNVESYIGLLNFKQRIQTQNQQLDTMKKQLYD